MTQRFRRAVGHVMNKAFRLLAIAPLLAINLFAVVPVGREVMVPEAFLPGLDAILKQAMQQSPQMLNRAIDLEIVENDRIQARASLLPSLNAGFRYYEAEDKRANNPLTLGSAKTYYDLTVTQPLFYWGERRNAAKIGEIQALIGQGQYRDGYRLFAREVRNLYQSLILQKIMVERSAHYRKQTQTILRGSEELLTKKAISDADIFSVRITAEQAQISWERTVNDFEYSKLSFARLTGIGSIQDEMIPDEIPAINYNKSAYSQILAGFLGQKDLPTMDAYVSRQQMAVQELNYASTKTRLKPKVNLVLGISQDEQSYSQNLEDRYAVQSMYGGVSVSWAIFDGFATRAATRTAFLRKKQMESNYHQLTLQLTQLAQNQVKSIELAARNMSIVDRYLESAEGNLKSKQEEFKRGVIAESDVNGAQFGLYDARINAYSARRDYLSRVADLLGTVMADPVLANLGHQ